MLSILLSMHFFLTTINTFIDHDNNPSPIPDEIGDIYESRTVLKKNVKNDDACKRLFSHKFLNELDDDLCIYTEIICDVDAALEGSPVLCTISTSKVIGASQKSVLVDFRVLYSWNGRRIRICDNSRAERIHNALDCDWLTDGEKNEIIEELCSYIRSFYTDFSNPPVDTHSNGVVGFMISIHKHIVHGNTSQR